MRASNRTKILNAAVALVEREGVTAITFDAVAAESGLTRGGLLYHFPSREDLMRGVHAHMASTWEASMERIAGGPADAVPKRQRHMAYIMTAAEVARRAELALMLESVGDPENASSWSDVVTRWAPPRPLDDSETAVADYVAGLAADGLWIQEALLHRPVPEALKARIIARLVALLAGDEDTR